MEHIETRRLFETADGLIQLDNRETEHLKQCEDCREALRVFTRHTKDLPPHQKKNGTDR